MRRVILILAAAVLGVGGCRERHHDGCDFTTMELDLTFINAAGAAVSCASSGTAYYRVFIDGASVTDNAGNPIDYACADGNVVDVVDVATGVPQSVQVDAYDVSGNLLYQFLQDNVTLQGCGVNVVAADLPWVRGAMSFGYSLPGGNQCPVGPVGSFVWFSIFNVTDNVVFATVDGYNHPTDWPCGTQLTFPDAVFAEYRLDFIEIVTPIGGSTYQVDFEDCTPRLFQHFAANDVFDMPTLAPASASCH